MTLSGNWIVTNRRLSSETVSPISPRPNPIASRPIIDSSSSESLGTGCCGDSEMGPCGRILVIYRHLLGGVGGDQVLSFHM